MKQFGRRQQNGRISELIKAVQEELSILIALGGGTGQPSFGLFPILFHIPTQEIQLAQRVLGKLISLPGGNCEILQGFLHILGNSISGEINLSKTIPGKLVSMVSGFAQPAYRFFRAFLTEEQLASAYSE